MLCYWQSETKKELEDLAKDGELPLEDLLKSLPEEVLATPAPLPDSAAESSSENEEKVINLMMKEYINA